MNNVELALARSRGIANTARNDVAMFKAAGGNIGSLLSPGAGMSQLSGFSDRAANSRRYELNRGWVHAAVNALAMEGASQEVKMGRLVNDKTKDEPKKKKSINGNHFVKSAREEYETLTSHPFLDALEKPNTIQYRWQFVYSFIANLCLTGWSYVVMDTDEEGNPEFCCMPTTWVEPIHDPTPFAKFKIRNPNNPMQDAEPLDASQVRFAFIPNPSNPLAATSLAGSQMAAIRIDDYIQSSQTAFFQNGIFPSVIVTVGSDPHPHAGKGIRPRLSAAQRRQVYSAIKSASAGVANYGNPAIVDGLIESIERLSATQNEMGWEKSEKAIRTRILSAFGVHPYILGEEMAGSYAQAYNVEKRFYKRVNSFLDMLSLLMTDFVVDTVDSDLFVWWQPCEPVNPDLEIRKWDSARNRDDVSQNEYREWMGLPPDEDRNESIINKSSVQAVAGVAEKVSAGALTVEQAVGILRGMGLPDDIAKDIAGKGAIKPPEPTPEEQAAQQQDQQAAQQLDEAMKMLKSPLHLEFSEIDQLADMILG